MWNLKKPEPVKLIIGILAADENCLVAAIEALESEFGKADLISDIWPFTQTDYYSKETGENILRQFVSIEELIDPGNFAAYLAGFGIEKAVILPENNPLVTGVVPNEYVLEFCENRDIYVPFCTVNPSIEPNPVENIKKYIRMGAAGLKLYPSYSHFFPNDKKLYPVYELAQELGFPVLIHTGSSVFKGSRIKYADPLYLDDLAVDFPDCTFLMAHGGRGIWYETAFLLSRLHHNMYLEISGLPPRNLLKYYPDLEKNIDKVVFGSDWPGIKSIGTNIEAIKKLPLSEQAKHKILYLNAARILGL